MLIVQAQLHRQSMHDKYVELLFDSNCVGNFLEKKGCRKWAEDASGLILWWYDTNHLCVLTKLPSEE